MCFPIDFRKRPLISLAAALVNVITRIFSSATLCSIRFVRSDMTMALPEPGPVKEA